VLGQSRQGRTAADLLDQAVDSLLEAGDKAAATALHCRYAEAIDSQCTGSACPAENHILHGVGDYSRRSATGQETRILDVPALYHAPKSGPCLAGTHAAPRGFLAPSRKQQSARAEFCRLFAGRNRSTKSLMNGVAKLAAKL